MSRRTRAREIALQVLYMLEQNAGTQAKEFHRFVDGRLRGDRPLVQFAEELISGVLSEMDSIDAKIASVAENWRIDRMAAIDRNILRLGAFELLRSGDLPAKVAINEALELAKRYSTAQSSRFVNGVLDRLHAIKFGNGASDELKPLEGAPNLAVPEPPKEAAPEASPSNFRVRRSHVRKPT